MDLHYQSLQEDANSANTGNLIDPSGWDRAHTTTVAVSTPLEDNRRIYGSRKRTWMACARCRMKKSKCDGQFPCGRCKDDCTICTVTTCHKMKCKRLPKGYAEVLENSQLTLVATIHKLYSMVRNSQAWNLGEPFLNNHGLPVVHNIAQKLGCIQRHGDPHTLAHSTMFPEDKGDMAVLASQLREKQQWSHEGDKDTYVSEQDTYNSASYEAAEWGRELGDANRVWFSPHHLKSGSDFMISDAPPDIDPASVFSSQSCSLSSFPCQEYPKTSASQCAQRPTSPRSMAMLENESSAHTFGSIGLDYPQYPIYDDFTSMEDHTIYDWVDEAAHARYLQSDMQLPTCIHNEDTQVMRWTESDDRAREAPDITLSIKRKG